MTDKETTMYQILGQICQADAPIVFKGALVTKLILSEHGYTALERQTRDIDANWIGVITSYSIHYTKLYESLKIIAIKRQMIFKPLLSQGRMKKTW